MFARDPALWRRKKDTRIGQKEKSDCNFQTHKAPVNPERSAVESISHQACINQPYYFLYLLIFWYLKYLPGEEEIAPARASWSLQVAKGFAGARFSYADKRIPSPYPQPAPLSEFHTPSQHFPCPKPSQGHVPSNQRPSLKAQPCQNYSNGPILKNVLCPALPFPWRT